MSFVVCALFVLSLAGAAAAETGRGREELKVENGRKISVDVENKSLSSLLRMMADKKLFDLSGREGGANEPLTLHFSKLTLSEALSKMMRGYSYVLVDEGKGRPVLTVLGKAQRGAPGSDSRQEPKGGTPPDQGAPTAAGPLPPVQARQPLAPPQPQQTTQQPPAGGQQQTTQQPPPGGEQPAQGSRQQLPVQQQAQQPAQSQVTGGQPAQGGQQAGQQQPGSQQAPAAPAPPPEPEGVHF